MAEKTQGPKEGDLLAGKFRIEKIIGQGGMGAVFLATHEGLRQKFAIKVLLGEISDNAEAVGRFMNEASAAAAINSEHVARVTDVSKTDEGHPYMVMEYLEGQDLAQLIETRGALSPGEAVDYVLQSLEAIHQAHECKIVHRDLKPSNLFLSKRPDGSFVVKVLDFGISKMQGPNQNGALTRTQSMLGSPLYMSPEQLRSSKTVDHRSDIWSIGVIIYELLTGTVPYNGESIGELFAAILEQDVPSVRERNPSVDPGLEAVVMKCLQKKKEDRWGSVAELAGALAPYAPAGKVSTLALRMTQGMVQPAMVAPNAPNSATAMLAGAPMRPVAPSYAGQTGSASWAAGSGPVPEPPRKSTGIFIGIGALALVLVGGVGGYAFMSKSSAANAPPSSNPSVPSAITAQPTVAAVTPTAVAVEPSASAIVAPASAAPTIAAVPKSPRNPVAQGGGTKALSGGKSSATAAAKPPPPSGGLGGRND